MKRWKYLLGMAILLCLVVTLMALPVFGAQIVKTGSCGDNVFYTLDSDGVLTISGSGEVDDSAFADDDTIKKVRVESGVTGIGSWAFHDCNSLISLLLPEELSYIEEYAFCQCDSLTAVNIPKSVTVIGEDAFWFCSNLQGFWVDSENSTYTSDEHGVLLSKDMTTLIQAPCGIKDVYTAPDGLTSIGRHAFANCDSLISVLLPEGLINIGDEAFVSCNGLTRLVLPKGLVSIGDAAFLNCNNLLSVSLPDGLVSIGKRAFDDCASLTDVTLPKGITRIEERTFSLCRNLTSVILPDGITSIGVEAFYQCNSLADIILPAGLTRIEDRAFNSCAGLVCLTFPEELDSIGRNAFLYADNLEQLIFLGDVPNFSPDSLAGLSATVYYPEGNPTWNNDTKQKYGGLVLYNTLGVPTELQISVDDPHFFVGETMMKERFCVLLIYDSGARAMLHHTQFSFTGGYLVTPGVKIIKVSAYGVVEQIPVYVHNGGLIQVDSEELPHSEHNYADKMDETKILFVPDALKIWITFSEQTKLENNYDNLYIYDGQGVQIAQYTGIEAAGATLIVQGDTVKIRLVSDTSVTEWGYALSSVEAKCVEHVYETEDGSCMICNGTYVCDHSFDEGVVSSYATCEEMGVSTYTCIDCGDRYTEIISAIGHSWMDASCEMSCYCIRCGETEGEPLGHSYDAVVTAPGCTGEGFTTYTCVRCGDSYKGDYVSATGHSWKDATCIEAKTCKNCGTVSGEPLGHNYREAVTAPDCTSGGYTTHTCGRCGDSYKDSYVSATGHSWKEATCTEAKICKICGIVSGEPMGHDYREAVTAPTCMSEGYTAYTCVRCGDSYKGSYVGATGHDWVDATCTEPKTCRNCGETEGEALGHDYVVTTGICSRCGGRAPFSVETPRMELCYGSTQVKVKAQWTKVSGVDGYELYMSTDPDDLESFAVVKSVLDPNTLSYTKGSLTPGVTYYFRVCAFVFLEDGITRVRSSLSNVKYCMPTVVWDAPYSNSDFRIRLRWEPVEGADGFQIWRKGEGEDYRVVKTLKDGGADAYSNVSLKAGGTYTYKMRAYFINEDGSKSYGAYSDEITVGVQPSKPKVTVVSTKAGRAQVSWEDLYGASAYQVWMSESPNSGFKIAKSIYDGDVTSYTKSGLVSGKTYYFKVRASVEIDGKKTFGAYSEVIAVTVK